MVGDGHLLVRRTGADSLQDVLCLLQAPDLDGDGEEDLGDSLLQDGRFFIDTGGIAIDSVVSAADSGMLDLIGLSDLATTAAADTYLGNALGLGSARRDGGGGTDEVTGTAGEERFRSAATGQALSNARSGDDVLVSGTDAPGVASYVDSGRRV